jgi:hypothetical protein
MIREIQLQKKLGDILCFRLCGTVTSNLGSGLSNEIRALGLLAKQQDVLYAFV